MDRQTDTLEQIQNLILIKREIIVIPEKWHEAIDQNDSPLVEKVF